jgi:hypothetical protein
MSVDRLSPSARVEAISLLTRSAHFVRALANELRSKRTMDGHAIDEIISAGVAPRSLEIERQRRSDWMQRKASAAEFLKGLESCPWQSPKCDCDT